VTAMLFDTHESMWGRGGEPRLVKMDRIKEGKTVILKCIMGGKHTNVDTVRGQNGGERREGPWKAQSKEGKGRNQTQLLSGGEEKKRGSCGEKTS